MSNRVGCPSLRRAGRVREADAVSKGEGPFSSLSTNGRRGDGGSPWEAPPLLPTIPCSALLTEALVYHEYFRHSDKVGLAVATGGMGMMSMDANGDAISLRTDGLVMKVLLRSLRCGVAGRGKWQLPSARRSGTVAVDKGARPSGSSTYPLDVFAAISSDHKRLEVSVVNPTETAQDCELNLAGAQVEGTAKVWRIATSSGPTPVPARAGGVVFGPPATMAETTMQQVPRTISLPPASISVYEFEIRQ